MDPDDFIKHIDALMYEDKKLRNGSAAVRELNV